MIVYAIVPSITKFEDVPNILRRNIQGSPVLKVPPLVIDIKEGLFLVKGYWQEKCDVYAIDVPDTKEIKSGILNIITAYSKIENTEGKSKCILELTASYKFVDFEVTTDVILCKVGSLDVIPLEDIPLEDITQIFPVKTFTWFSD